MRVTLEPAYVLRTAPYRETSLLLEVLSLDHGRVGLVAKGARQPRSRLRGVLQPFSGLLVSWTGHSELSTLTGAEPAGGDESPRGRRLLAGFYLNELLLRLVPRSDPHPAVFGAYRAALAGLVLPTGEEETLRVFEKRLLDALGYAMPLERAADGADAIDPGGLYRYEVERGPVPVGAGGGPGVLVHGETLLALAAERIPGEAVRREAKQLMRSVLSHYLGDRPLRSRELFRGPAPLGASGPSEP
jgi:DNA repair protein RecO (recombination protein O)